MNATVGYWEMAKSKLKKKFTTLTEQDLSFIDGKESIMLERLQYKLRMSKEELRDILINL